MKEKSDLSKDTQEQFEFLDEVYDFPIHLDPDVDEFTRKLAKELGTDVEQLINEWLRATIKLIKTLQPSFHE